MKTGEWVLPDTVRAVSAIWFPDHLVKLVLKYMLQNVHVNVRGWEWLDCSASRQDVSRCCTRGGSEDFVMCMRRNTRARESTMALKPRADVTKSPKTGISGPTKVLMSSKILKNIMFTLTSYLKTAQIIYFKDLITTMKNLDNSFKFWNTKKKNNPRNRVKIRLNYQREWPIASLDTTCPFGEMIYCYRGAYF